MSRSAIYTANTSDQTVVIDNNINLGSIQRRFGCALDLSGFEIRVKESGYYEVNSSVTVSSETPGEVVITLYKDNVIVPGATAAATIAAAGDFTNLSIDAIIREGCQCCDGASNLTIKVSSPTEALTSVTVNNIAAVVEKL